MLVPGVRRSVLFLLPLLAAVPSTAAAASHRGEPARARGVAWVGTAQPAFLRRRELLTASVPACAILAASQLGRQVRKGREEAGQGLRGGGMLGPVVDSACHVWVDSPQFPFAKQAADAIPWTKGGAAEAASAELLLELMDNNAVDKTVLIQPICYAFDNTYVLSCATKWPDRFAAVARVDPQDASAPETLERLVRQGAVGVRFGPVQQAWWEAPLMGDILDKAAELDVPVLLFLGKDGGRALEWVAPVLRKHPSTKVVIDHMADVPPADEDQILALLGLKTLPNLYVKISHTWAISTEGAYPWSDGVTLARRVITTFGPARAMFASDWPVCTRPVWPGGAAAYEETVRLAKEEVAGGGEWGDEGRGALLGGTAASLFFPSTP